MAKKYKDEAPNPNSVQNRDILHRMNFLYQASTYLNALGSTSPKSKPSSDAPVPEPLPLAIQPGKQKKQKRLNKQKERQMRRRPSTLQDLSRTYIRSMKIIGQKTTVRMDPSVKRTLCRGCNIVLVPGSTAITRVKPSRTHGRRVMYKCMSCKASLRIPAQPILEPGEDTVPEEAPTSTAMDVDPPVDLPPASSGINRKTKKKPPKARPLSHFERKDGYVIFRGNEILHES